MANYPDSIYEPREKENRSGVEYDETKKTVIFAEDIENDDDEIVAIETELGTNAKGVFASVKAWLEDLTSKVISYFTDIPDVPSSYSGQGGKAVAVKGSEDGLEFINFPGGGFSSRARAYLGVTQTVPTGTFTKINLSVENFDGLGEFDSTTNYRFTAQATGYYLFAGAVGTDTGFPDGKNLIAMIYKNGSEYMRNEVHPGSAGYAHAFLSDIVYLAANDYLELWVYHAKGSDQNFRHKNPYNFLSIHRIS